MAESKSKIVYDAPTIYQIPVSNPRPGSNPTNAYLIVDSGKALLVDTGVDSDEGLAYLRAALDELDVDLPTLDVLLTHVHQDHSGLVGRLGFGGKLYLGKREIEAWSGQNRLDYLNRVGRAVTLMGEPDDVAAEAVKMCTGSIHPPETGAHEVIYLDEGDEVRVGNVRFSVLVLPGHTPGSIALYQPVEHLLVSGDVVIFEVTPALAIPDEGHDFLSLYVQSVKRLLEIPIDFIFPGHGVVQGDPTERIEWLVAHHAKRLERARRIVAGYPGIRADELAKQLRWNAPTRGNSDFARAAHVMVVLASVSYLNAIAGHDGIERTVQDGVWHFSPTPAVPA